LAALRLRVVAAFFAAALRCALVWAMWSSCSRYRTASIPDQGPVRGAVRDRGLALGEPAERDDKKPPILPTPWWTTRRSTCRYSVFQGVTAAAKGAGSVKQIGLRTQSLH
jgi:hypothetical protein